MVNTVNGWCSGTFSDHETTPIHLFVSCVNLPARLLSLVLLTFLVWLMLESREWRRRREEKKEWITDRFLRLGTSRNAENICCWVSELFSSSSFLPFTFSRAPASWHRSNWAHWHSARSLISADKENERERPISIIVVTTTTKERARETRIWFMWNTRPIPEQVNEKCSIDSVDFSVSRRMLAVLFGIFWRARARWSLSSCSTNRKQEGKGGKKRHTHRASLASLADHFTFSRSI